jgi:putative DNA primase/helicase
MKPLVDSAHMRTLPALEELQARPQWVCWRKEQRRGKSTKIPYNAVTGQWAKSDAPATWSSYPQAIQALRAYGYHGVGYMFCRDYTGIDLDHCVREDGSIDPWAQAYLERLPSYAEYSPSKTGIHVLVRGTIPSGTRRAVPGAPHSQAAIEMYCERRYYTVTGNHIAGTSTTIEACPELLTIHTELTPPTRKQLKAAARSDGHASSPTASSDDTVIDRAMHARNGATFQALWEGDTSGYGSQSEAELALCNLLAFWTGKDAQWVDHLFRRSALYRSEKWDRAARSGETYGQGTLSRAIANCTETYHTPKRGTIIHLRRGQAALDSQREENRVQLPETDLELVLECLQDEEEGDARLYAHLFQGRCIYDHTEGVWYEWQGHAWDRDECKHALLLASGPLASVYLDASAQLSQAAAQTEKHLDPDLLTGHDPQHEHYLWLKAMTGRLIERARSLKKLRRAQAVLTYAQAYLKVTARQWDRHSWLLACPNGVLDLRTGELHSGRPEDYLRTSIPTAWRGLETPAPRWERFLQEVFEDREQAQRTELIAFLQRLLGYGITGAVHEHVFGVLYGAEGRNGKDTIQHALNCTLGELSSAISKDVLLDTGRMRSAGSATPHLCDLHGRRLTWASEPEKGARFSVSQVKELSGGGDIPVRGLYEKYVMKVKPSHLLLLLTNHKPYADPDDKAFWERLRLVTFNMRFVANPVGPNERAKDTNLWKDLEAEASGILAWLVRGCLQWQRQGLASPAAVLSEGEAYRKEQDHLDVFFADCCVIHEKAVVGASSLFEAYNTWGKTNNMRHLLSGTAFGTRMGKRYKKKPTVRGNVYLGIGLANDSDPHSFEPAAESLPHETSREERGTPPVPEEETPSAEGVEGLMEGFGGLFFKPSIGRKTALEADALEGETLQNEGLKGTNRKSAEVKHFGPYRGLSVNTLHTLHFGEKTSPLDPLGERDEVGLKGLQKCAKKPSIPLQTLHLVETVDGLGYLSGKRQEQDVTFVASERKEALRYKIGVVILNDGAERFYYPRTVLDAHAEAIQMNDATKNRGDSD